MMAARRLIARYSRLSGCLCCYLVIIRMMLSFPWEYEDMLGGAI